MQFPINEVPIPGRAQPLQIPQRYDPAGIIMQTAALRQQRDLQQQQMQIETANQFREAIMGGADLLLRKRQMEAQNLIAQQGLDIAKEKIPIEQAQAKLLQLQADAWQAGVGGPFYKAKQAAMMIGGPDAKTEDIQNIQKQLNSAYPGGLVPKDYAHQIALASHFSQSLGLKKTEFEEKKWDALNREYNPLLAGSRKPVGLIATNNMRLANLRAIISDPSATDQRIAMAVTDLGAVMKGGAPDEQMVANQMYPTLQNRYNKFITNLTASPQMAKQPGVINQLLGIADDLQQVNNRYTEAHFKTARANNPSLLASDPARYMNWENAMRQALYPASMSSPQAPMQNYASQQPSRIGGAINRVMEALGLSSPAIPGGGQQSPNPYSTASDNQIKGMLLLYGQSTNP